MLKKLKTLYNTKEKSIIAKLGCIAAHRKALLAIFSNQTRNNLILEEDANLSGPLPAPPEESDPAIIKILDLGFNILLIV